ncbi:hypothetical protein EVAR_53870_1 [Eumeta japonica]|uniref:Uncharacterized protein n=1 Tax=Eumeta variegata TaxID=151549 RepID=A0A4C1XGG8_EUMVA|nr:hypothetical protein EVAR_53870_1 [Eumeta japonica]
MNLMIGAERLQSEMLIDIRNRRYRHDAAAALSLARRDKLGVSSCEPALVAAARGARRGLGRAPRRSAPGRSLHTIYSVSLERPSRCCYAVGTTSGREGSPPWRALGPRHFDVITMPVEVVHDCRIGEPAMRRLSYLTAVSKRSSGSSGKRYGLRQRSSQDPSDEVVHLISTN